jgi:hypothetical protein
MASAELLENVRLLAWVNVYLGTESSSIQIARVQGIVKSSLQQDLKLGSILRRPSLKSSWLYV